MIEKLKQRHCYFTQKVGGALILHNVIIFWDNVANRPALKYPMGTVEYLYLESEIDPFFVEPQKKENVEAN